MKEKPWKQQNKKKSVTHAKRPSPPYSIQSLSFILFIIKHLSLFHFGKDNFSISPAVQIDSHFLFFHFQFNLQHPLDGTSIDRCAPSTLLAHRPSPLSCWLPFVTCGAHTGSFSTIHHLSLSFLHKLSCFDKYLLYNPIETTKCELNRHRDFQRN